jgi:hypothetical protein
MAIAMSAKNTQDVFDPFIGASFDVLNDVDHGEDGFDPFHVGEVETKMTTPTKSNYHDDGVNHSNISKQASPAAGSVALPPRIVVKFRLHEEVASEAILKHQSEGASDVFVQGTLHVSSGCI